MCVPVRRKQVSDLEEGTERVWLKEVGSGENRRAWRRSGSEECGFYPLGQWRGLVSTNPLVREGPGESRLELRWLLPWLWPVSGSAPLHLGVPTSQKGPQLPPGARFVGELQPETTG